MTITAPEQFSGLMQPISDLKPDPKNARKHDDKNIDAIKESLKQFGWRSVIVAHQESKTVLSGNGRLEAAKQLGVDQVPVLYVTGDENDAASYALADNRSAELATWDEQMLATVIGELVTADIDLKVMGWDEKEVDAILADVVAIVEEPDVEPPPERDTSNLPVNQEGAEDNKHLVAEKMPSSNVRLVQLFLDDTNIEEFNLAVRKLASHHGTENITDTVQKTVLQAAEPLN